MNRKTIYIAGPIRGMEDSNSAAFDAAHKLLEKQGWHVVDPFDITDVFGVPADVQSNPRLLRAVMDAELAMIPRLDAIYLLRGWERSEGAKKELEVALEYGLIVMVEGNENGAEVAQ